MRSVKIKTKIRMFTYSLQINIFCLFLSKFKGYYLEFIRVLVENY